MRVRREEIFERAGANEAQHVVFGDPPDHLADDRPRTFRLVPDQILQILGRLEMLRIGTVPHDAFRVREVRSDQFGVSVVHERADDRRGALA